MKEKLPMITILGPTACGKTRLAVALARQMDGEIISADSRQVYRRMDIGTGKDLDEYGEVPYHLIDICEPGTKYNLYRYQEDFRVAYEDIRSRGCLPILCGGTGLYIEAVLKGYNLPTVPQNQALREQLEGWSLDELTAMLKELKAKNGTAMHNTTDVDSCRRAIRAIEIETYLLEHADVGGKTADHRTSGENAGRMADVGTSLIIGVDIGRELRRQKITIRLKERLEKGMVDEVRALLNSGIEAEDLIYYGLEYRYVTEYVIGRLSYDEMFRQLEIAIHQFAKRQMTWFRGMERRGFTIHWVDGTLPVEEIVREWLKG